MFLIMAQNKFFLELWGAFLKREKETDFIWLI